VLLLVILEIIPYKIIIFYKLLMLYLQAFLYSFLYFQMLLTY